MEQGNNAAMTSVSVVDIRMPFWSMVVFLVKLAIASIPAVIILFILGSVLGAVFGGMFMAGHH